MAYRSNDPAPYATTTLAMQNKVRTMVKLFLLVGKDFCKKEIMMTSFFISHVSNSLCAVRQ